MWITSSRDLADIEHRAFTDAQVGVEGGAWRIPVGGNTQLAGQGVGQRGMVGVRVGDQDSQRRHPGCLLHDPIPVDVVHRPGVDYEAFATVLHEPCVGPWPREWPRVVGQDALDSHQSSAGRWMGTKLPSSIRLGSTRERPSAPSAAVTAS